MLNKGFFELKSIQCFKLQTKKRIFNNSALLTTNKRNRLGSGKPTLKNCFRLFGLVFRIAIRSTRAPSTASARPWGTRGSGVCTRAWRPTSSTSCQTSAWSFSSTKNWPTNKTKQKQKIWAETSCDRRQSFFSYLKDSS